MKGILYAGVTPGLHPAFAKRIILTNVLGLLFGVNMSLSACAFFFFGYHYLGAFTVLFALSEFAWPLFNRFRRYGISRMGLLLTSNLLGGFVSVCLPDTGYNNGFYVMAGLGALLFDLRERKSIIAGILLPVILLPLSQWGQYNITLARPSLAPEARMLIEYGMGSVYVLLIFLMFYFLSKENGASEAKLEAALRDLEAQKARAFSSAKFAALGEMAGGIAHEINNPMTAIDLITEKLRVLLSSPSVLKDEARQELDRISTITHRVGKIVNAMRTFSRDAGRDSFRMEPLQTIVEETLSFTTARFEHHGVRFELSCDLGDFELSCKAVQISQVILNLLNNAFDAVEFKKEKWIKLEASLEPGRSKVILAVSDNGVGVAMENREKIFQPFFTTKPVGKGTGLGLSLSRKIVDDHGGNLMLDTASPYTRFVVELPANFSSVR